MQLQEFDNSDMAKLAVAQAMYKRCAEIVSTKDPTSLRSRADAHFADMYALTGAKSYDINVDGQKVGTYSVRIGKDRDVAEVDVTDWAAYQEWAVANGFFNIDEKAVLRHFENTGEMPDGAEVVVRHVPGRPSGGTMRVDVPAVERVLGESAAIALLEGGAE